MSKFERKHKVALIVLMSIVGSVLVCILATLQKKSIGAPLVINGYILPFLLGAIIGAMNGIYICKIKSYSALLKERVNTLESHLRSALSVKIFGKRTPIQIKASPG